MNMKNSEKTIKIICLFIICALLISFISACSSKPAEETGGNNDNNSENQTQNPDGNVSAPEETPTEAEVKILPDLPEKDFGGYEFKVITSDYLGDSNMVQEIGSEEENGDPINDAIYARNKKIEEQYNVTVKEILYDRDTLNTPVKKAVMANDGAYDLICGNLRELGILSQGGHLLDLTKVNYLDLEKPWYDQKAAADLSVGHKLFFAVGELQISDNNGTWAILFNKKLLQELVLEDPYKLVLDGKWTMDKFFEMATAACKDLNGDGKMDEEDQWGTLGEGFNIYALMNGSGTRFIQKDENDLPYYAGYTSRDIDIFEKGAEYLGDKNRSMLAENFSSKYSNVWYDLVNPIFATDRILFFFTSLSRVTWHRSSETDFGILPTPKYEEQQENYLNTVSVWMASGMGIPATFNGDDLDRTAIITEALSAESMYTLTPAYYDIQLKTKLTRDDESAEMLDMIFANRTYSLAHLYDWGGMISTIQTMLTQNNRNFVSSMDKIANRITKDIDKTIAAYEGSE
ncbi:MAG: extracellular solute-binding protein [Oscillospiraceae bacterium]|nr:extracellular solute-binding protein [Oscillospiraceae bacterium]